VITSVDIAPPLANCLIHWSDAYFGGVSWCRPFA